PDILFYPFDFSVGMEKIFNTRYAYKVIGYSLGIAAATAVLFAGIAIFRQMSPFAIRWLFFLMLVVFFCRQLLNILQIGLGRNLMPRTPGLVSFTIDWINRTQWFMYAAVILAAATAVVVYWKNRHARFVAPNQALSRKLKAAARIPRRWCGVLGGIFVAAILTVTVGAAYENQEVVLSPPLEVAVTGDRILIPIPMVEDGRLHRFKHHAPDGTEIRYIVIKKNETAFGVGLDACDICGASGYYERNGQVICILCDVVMNISTIGFPGGCNPVPLAYRVEDGHMRINIADLEKDAWRFKE
ncbi:MAG: Fe-S-containing protein, partial [Planctomycetes bacterium]|nr:Fe-S-containing protein [Planctomycetota bacterium]